MSAFITPAQYREQARLFDSYAQKLREIADMMEGRKPAGMAASVTPEFVGSANGAVTPGSKTRAEQVRDFLLQSPGKKRGEICKETGIPSGTVDMVLRKPGFKRDAAGKYRYVEKDE